MATLQIRDKIIYLWVYAKAVIMKWLSLLTVRGQNLFIDRFHVTSEQPYWYSQTMRISLFLKYKDLL